MVGQILSSQPNKIFYYYIINHTNFVVIIGFFLKKSVCEANIPFLRPL